MPKSYRRAKDEFFRSRSRRAKSLDDFFDEKTSKPKKRRKDSTEDVLNIKRCAPLEYSVEKVGSESQYITNNGAYIIVGEGYIVAKMPYGLSANAIWRATINNDGVQRNSLSKPARDYKNYVRALYAPLFRELEISPINTWSQVRIVAQPPKKERNYSARSYPRFDVDNYPKIIIDSMKGILFKDDNILNHVQVVIAEPVEEGCVWLSCIIQQQSTEWIDQSVDYQWLSGKAVEYGCV